MKRTKIGIAILSSITLFSLIFGGFVSAKPLLNEIDSNNSKAEYVPDEIIVRFKGDTESFRVIKVSKGMVGEEVRGYLEREDVEYAEPNFIAHTQMTPNDSYYGYQWHMDNSEYGGINMEAAWDISSGLGVTVAVIDTGIAYEDYNRYKQAPDLAQTCFVTGYDFVNDDTHPNDDEGHGTHVAGTVAQSTNNDLGVAGVAFSTCLMPVKVLDRNGSGTYADVAAGIYYATDNGAQVINLSLGGSADSTTLKDAVAYAYNHGVTVVAAAGNDNSSTISYPAAYDDYVIAVGATRYDETRAYYSNYGLSLDIVAPGGDVNVDQNNDGYGDGILQQTFGRKVDDFGYYFYQGTSMASPHIAGVAALVIANGVTGPDNVRAAIEATAEDLGTTGWDEIFGWGLVDAAAALAWTAGPVDNLPTVSITNPLDGSTVVRVITISADATDDVGVTQVDFYVDGGLIGSDIESPYEISWDSTTVSDGSHTVSATAIDTASQTASDSISVLVDNVNDSPIANAGPDQSAYIDDTVYFDGSGSTDDGEIVSYDWNFGDGATASGITVEHIYAAEGEYIVTLTVTDDGGLTSNDTAIVTVTTVPAESTEVIVDSITYITEGGRNGDKHLDTTLALVDDFGNLVSNASVSIILDNTTTGSSWPETGTTGDDGIVTFSLKNAPSGCYVTTVTDVIFGDLTWDGITPGNELCK
ncbi:MAG: S8 family serine peptidase [Patescibacteria group bacterium]|nr:S8 family serine peptidase [Patescibacteria group bacterium]